MRSGSFGHLCAFREVACVAFGFLEAWSWLSDNGRIPTIAQFTTLNTLLVERKVLLMDGLMS